MFKFHESIFSENHKSYYNETDLKALDECRTIVPNGRCEGQKTMIARAMNPVLAREDMRSIDTRKTDSHQATKITRIPVFNDFDVWKPYTKKKILTNSITTPGS